MVALIKLYLYNFNKLPKKARINWKVLTNHNKDFFLCWAVVMYCAPYGVSRRSNVQKSHKNMSTSTLRTVSSATQEYPGCNIFPNSKKKIGMVPQKYFLLAN